MNSAVVLLNGGIGSTVAAFRRREDTLLHPLYLDYGRANSTAQRRAASAVAQRLGTSLRILDLPHVGQLAASRAAPSTGGVRTAVGKLGAPHEIPGLPVVLLSVGAQYAATVGAHLLICGRCDAGAENHGDVLAQERSVDPRELRHAFGVMLESSLPAVRAVSLETPLIDLQPGEVVKLANHVGAPLELTWSCRQNNQACGSCPDCRVRANAFSAAGLVDPLLAGAGQ